MELRWLTPEEQRPRVVESGSLAEVLALAQQLQAEAETRVSDEQVVEMGRELGVRPEYVREALRLRRHVAQTAPVPPAPPILERPVHQPFATVARAMTLGFGLGTLPMALISLSHSNAHPVAFFVLIAALMAGWSARHSRLAGMAGALTAPAVILASTLFLTAGPWHGPGVAPEAVFFSLLSFTPLSSAIGRMAAGLRRRLERTAESAPVSVSGH